jgi:tRNA(fMet)-specific endonuclease VapC
VSVWIFDTDHVSLVLRGHPQITDRLRQVSTQTSTSIITVQEIFNGWVGELNQPRTKREIIIEQYHHLFSAVDLLKRLPIVEFDASAFEQYETLLVQNPNLRKKRLQMDMRIAATPCGYLEEHALSRKATVVTRNRRDFEQVPGLRIED